MNTVKLALPIVLPEVSDVRDACVARLMALLTSRRGISEAHITDDLGSTNLCLHYDPNLLTLDGVEELAKTAGTEVLDKYGHRVWPIRAIASEDAGLRLERAVLSVPGVLAASVNLPGQVLRVEFERATLKPAEVEAAISAAGASTEPADQAPPSWYRRNRELVWSLTAGALLSAGFLLGRSGAGALVTLSLYLGSYAFGAYDLVRHAAKSITRGRFAFDIDLLMLVAAIGAACLGEWAEGAFLLFLFSFAHALEHYALERARKSIRDLASLAPPTARIQRDGRLEEIPVEQVRTGDLVLIRPAERVPVDGEIVEGSSAMNQAPITGESVPVDKAPGDPVFAGAINGEGAVTVKTTKAVGDRTLDRVIQLVEDAQTQKAPTQVFTDRFERVFVPCVLVAAALLAIGPPLLGIWDWPTSFYRAMALLVASSPCALALGTPATVLAGIAQAARRGVLVKGGVHLESLGTIKAIALDKTGTLTVGIPEVTDVVPLAAQNEGELLQVAAAVESQSQHPLAAAVVRKAASAGVSALTAESVESVTGRGIRARVSGRSVEIGNRRLFDEAGLALPVPVETAAARLARSGRSVMIVRSDDDWLGVIGLADTPRPGVREVLDRLRALGVKPIVMLTGDHGTVGQAIGKEVGVDEVRGDLLPEDKVIAIKDLLQLHKRVAMVGDGVNDAPALAQATVGIAMGAAGTATALETADVALMGDDLSRLPFAVGLSRRARAVIRQNLYLSLGVIAALVIATTTGRFGIGPAVFVHEGSTLVVIANALRLLLYEA